MVEKPRWDINEILKASNAHYQLSVPELIEAAVHKGEAILTATGALSAETGKYTGRSPHDKFIVDEPAIHDQIAWGSINKPIEAKKFEMLYQEMMDYLQE